MPKQQIVRVVRVNPEANVTVKEVPQNVTELPANATFAEVLAGLRNKADFLRT